MSADSMKCLGGCVILTPEYGNEALDMLEELWDFLRKYAVTPEGSENPPKMPSWVPDTWWQAVQEECSAELRGGVLAELTRVPELDTAYGFAFTYAKDTSATIGEASARLLECCLMLIHRLMDRAKQTPANRYQNPPPGSMVTYTLFDKTTCQGHTGTEIINAYSNAFDHNYDI